MKSILQSALLYACVTKSRDLDKKTDEVLASFIYVFWMLKFSGHSPTERLNISGGMAELWCLVFEVLRETKSWSHQHVLVSEKLLELAENESLEVVRRMTMVTTITVDMGEATREIQRFSSQMRHGFGNQLNFNLNGKEDAVMEIAANLSK